MLTTYMEKGREYYHSLVANHLPVTFTTKEFMERRRALDVEYDGIPEGPLLGARRLAHELAAALQQPAEVLASYVDEASDVELPDPRDDQRPLPSPMSRRDRLLLYATVRAVRPELAIETGIANGCSSAMILAAMERNDGGRLWGVDNLFEERDRLGRMIPPGLIPRFDLRLGDSLDELAHWCEKGVMIDLFLHDSDHSYTHARTEYELAWRMLRPGGVLCSHDILYNNAFDRFLVRHRRELSGFARLSNFGVVRKNLVG